MSKQTSTGCSNMDCTYSTCQIAHQKLLDAAPHLAEALQVIAECEGDTVAGRIARETLAKAGL